MISHRAVGAVLSLVVLVGACSSGGDGSARDAPVIDPGDGGQYAFDLTPDDFVDGIDNPYLPLAVGSRWVYDGDEHIEVTVTDETRSIMGITATVVRDIVSEDGEVVEDTLDFYAQDRDGNVWYLGEETAEYDGGEVTTTAGSWIAGENGALPGIAMPADPSVGDAYRQEFFAGEAEDMAEIIAVDATATVLGEEVTGIVTAREWTPLEPDVVEEKTYAPGVGNVEVTQTAGGSEHVTLTSFTAG